MGSPFVWHDVTAAADRAVDTVWWPAETFTRTDRFQHVPVNISAS